MVLSKQLQFWLHRCIRLLTDWLFYLMPGEGLCKSSMCIWFLSTGEILATIKCFSTSKYFFLTQGFRVTERTQWWVLFCVATCFRDNRGTTVTTTSAGRGGASYRHSVPFLRYSDPLFLCFVKVTLPSSPFTATAWGICDQTGYGLVLGKTIVKLNAKPKHVHTLSNCDDYK